MLSDFLTNARAHIVNGWCQHALGRTGDDGKLAVCALGALNMAESGHFLDEYVPRSQVWMSAWQLLTDLSLVGAVARYNNLETTTKEDVLAWFDTAIAIAKEKEISPMQMCLHDSDAYLSGREPDA